MEWTSSIGYRPDTFTMHASVYKNHGVLDNTNLKDFIIYQTSWIALCYHL